MATTVGDVIQGARDQHPAFDDYQHPDKMLRRQLSGYHRRLCAKAVHVNESILATEAIVALPLASFDAGYTLPNFQYLHGGDVLWVNGIDRSSFTLVPWAARNDAGKFPSGWVHGGVLYLRGEVGDWGGFASIHLSYTPMAPDFTALADVLLLPDSGADACEAFLALFMANRASPEPGGPRINVDLFAQQYRGAEDDFLADVFLRRTDQDSRIREVRSFS